MSGTTSRPPAPGTVTALTVHGPGGVLDLTVPTDGTLADVARVYAAEAGLPHPLPLVSRSGDPLQMSTTIGEAGLVAGSLVVAVDAASRPAPPQRGERPESGPPAVPRQAAAVWLTVAAVVAVGAGWAATRLPADDRWPVAVVLLVGALVGCLPFGVLAPQRVLAAPAFAGAAAFAMVWDPVPERLPMVFGVAALAAALAAAFGRALAEPRSEAEDGLRTWLIVGGVWFVVAGLASLAGAAQQTTWAVLLIAAVLAARFVPGMAIDVPDQYLLDLERLAVTAWSARERPRGRRGRIVVPEQAVAAVASSGTRTVRAASVAIFVVVAIAAPLLLWTADVDLDRTGARCLVGFGGASLLFAARSYRHAFARRMLRCAGVLALALVAVVQLRVFGIGGAPDPDAGLPGILATAAIAVAGILVLVAVVVGRGWPSAWWSRRAEIGEAICGSFAVSSLVVAVGIFRHLWELTS